jgi:hypothetical protein
MHYIIKTETGLEIVSENPVDRMDDIIYSGSRDICETLILEL